MLVVREVQEVLGVEGSQTFQWKMMVVVPRVGTVQVVQEVGEDLWVLQHHQEEEDRYPPHLREEGHCSSC